MKLFTEDQVNQLLAKQREADTRWVLNKTGITFTFRPIKLIEPFKIVCFNCHGDLRECDNGRRKPKVQACIKCHVFFDRGKWRYVGSGKAVDTANFIKPSGE